MPGVGDCAAACTGKLLTFSLPPLEEGLDGSYLDDGLLALREGFAYLPLLRRDHIHLRGDHNVSNVLAAFTIGHAAGFPLDAMLTAAEEFRGVPHRLELVREWNGAHWYNDSIATAPERTMAAIRSFDEPIVLLLGGHDKNLPWGIWRTSSTSAWSTWSSSGRPRISSKRRSAQRPGRRAPRSVAQGLHEAVSKAARVAESGSVVLLSPGGTSFDEFTDFAERGERFKTWVQELL